MKSRSLRRTVIVVAVEPSPANDEVLRTAAAAARMAPGSELHFVHVVDLVPPAYNACIPLSVLVADGQCFLNLVVTAFENETKAPLNGHIGVGVAAERILQIAADLAADLIIVGCHDRRGLARLGSVSSRVVRRATCPVLLARTKRVEQAPSVAPPCPDCIATQRSTAAERLWCDRHEARHAYGRFHYLDPQTFGDGAMWFRPTRESTAARGSQRHGA